MKIPAILAAAVLTAVSCSARANAIDQLKSFIESTRSARADFSQTVTGRSGRKPQLSSGTMMFARPGKFRWVYDKPYPQLLVGDGKKLWVYDPDLKQVSVKAIGDALGSSPAALLAGDNAIEKNFDLADGGSRDGLDWVEAKPKNAEAGFERMRIGFKGTELRAMEVLDNFGQTTAIRFSAFERNPPLAAELFRFVPPKGADVVGEK
jgi:outer membrane lipoprotein carrier protein